MLRPMARHLIIGADSLLGKALAGHLRSAGDELWLTSRRPLPQAEAENWLRLDLADPLDSWRPPPGLDCAYLLAAVTSVAQCRAHPQACRLINVDNSLRLARILARQGCPVVFLSSSLLFSGRQPLPEPGDHPDPPSEYGRQKLQTETGLLGLGAGAAALRVTKVVWPGMPLLRSWREDLGRGQAIHPFHDMFMAPVSLDLVTRVLGQMGRRRLPGVWHLSASHDLSYAQAAAYLARRLGVDAGLVQPVSRRQAGIAQGDAPARTALGMLQTSQAWGWSAPGPEEALEAVLLD